MRETWRGTRNWSDGLQLQSAPPLFTCDRSAARDRVQKGSSTGRVPTEPSLGACGPHLVLNSRTLGKVGQPHKREHVVAPSALDRCRAVGIAECQSPQRSTPSTCVNEKADSGAKVLRSAASHYSTRIRNKRQHCLSPKGPRARTDYVGSTEYQWETPVTVASPPSTGPKTATGGLGERESSNVTKATTTADGPAY